MLKRASQVLVLLSIAALIGCGDDVTLIMDTGGLTARGDSYTTMTDNGINQPAPGVLANDESRDGEPLLVISFDSTSLSGGTVSMTQYGGFSYTPPNDYSGLDSFTYVISDGENYAVASVRITVNPIPSLPLMRKRLALDAQPEDWLGDCVSMDGSYAIIGAIGDDTHGEYAGAAYVLHRDEGGADNWGQVAKLTASDAQGGEYFGYSVAIEGDYAIIGAPRVNNIANLAGAAYIFRREGDAAGNWGQVAKLLPGSPQEGAYAGASVALSDGHAIIGAPYEDDGGPSTGAAYIFEREGDNPSTWVETARLSSYGATEYTIFGGSVSIDGNTAVAGAYGDDARGEDSGAAFVYKRSEGGAGGWSQAAKLTALDAERADRFGQSVSISGDTIIAGAIGKDDDSDYAGAAYVFYRNRGGVEMWGQVTKLKPSDAKYGTTSGGALIIGVAFGNSVSLWGDLAIVGAPNEATGGNYSGAAYLFHRNKGGADNWGELSKYKAFDSAENDLFGQSVAIGVDSAIVGAPAESEGGDEAGATYILYGE